MFFWMFALFRHITSAMHFNNNPYRDIKKKADGKEQIKVVWPKFNKGEAPVRDVRVLPKFGKLCRK